MLHAKNVYVITKQDLQGKRLLKLGMTELQYKQNVKIVGKSCLLDKGAKMGIIKLSEKQKRELRKQELQTQGYHSGQLYSFIHRSAATEIMKRLTNFRLNRFDCFDTPDALIRTLGPGVYMFFHERKIQYIGRSGEMRSRIKRHVRAIEKKRYFPGDRIVTIGTYTLQEAKDLEDRLIISINPLRNKLKTLQGRRR